MIVICTVCDAEAACCDDSCTLVPGARGAGEVVRVSLHNGSTTTVAKGLSCPEGVALDDLGFLYVVENPVGDECQAEFPIKKAAQLTRIDLRSGAQTRVAGLRSSTTGEEGGPSSHTQTHVRVSICAARTLLKSHRSAQDPPMAAVRARVLPWELQGKECAVLSQRHVCSIVCVFTRSTGRAWLCDAGDNGTGRATYS